eukprot:m.906435 g.906435  ORF g.906435 m.906435 type:complete len:63 (+) comp60075_c1_seq1:43-231(+)
MLCCAGAGDAMAAVAAQRRYAPALLRDRISAPLSIIFLQPPTSHATQQASDNPETLTQPTFA